MKLKGKFPNESAGHLRVVKGGKKKQRSSDLMISNAWLFAQASLWEGQNFSEEEVSKFKKLIKEFFEEEGYSEESLIEFCERVTLAKRYVARSSFRYIAAPINWLNIHFKYGISGTQRWYKDVEEQRKTAPEYHKGMGLLADAVVTYTKNPSPLVYREARKKLIEQRQFDLVPVFNSLVTAFHYLNQ